MYLTKKILKGSDYMTRVNYIKIFLKFLFVNYFILSSDYFIITIPLKKGDVFFEYRTNFYI